MPTTTHTPALPRPIVDIRIVAGIVIFYLETANGWTLDSKTVRYYARAGYTHTRA